MAHIHTLVGRSTFDAEAFALARKTLDGLAGEGPPFGSDELVDELDLHYADLDQANLRGNAPGVRRA